MSADAVYQALYAAITTDDTIDLWTAANGSDDLKGLLPVLKLFGITGPYVLGTALLTRSADRTTVTLTGNGAFGQPGAAAPNQYPVSATLLYTDQGNTFGFSLRVTDPGWTFSNFFPNLPETLMLVPAEGEGIRWYPSFLTGMRVSGLTFSAQSGLGQLLQMSGFLQEPADPRIPDLVPMIGPWPLRLSGTLIMPGDAQAFPIFRIDAKGSAASVLNGAKEDGVDGPAAIALTDLGLTLVSAALVPPQPDRVAFTTLELYGTLNLGEISGRISTLILSTGSTWNFTLRFDKETSSMVQGLAQLTRWFGVELPIPMNFPILSDFYFSQIDIDLLNTAAPGANPSFSLLNFAVTIRSDKTWKPPVPFVTFQNVGTRWVWGWTYAADGNGGTTKSYLLTGSVFGTLAFGSGSGKVVSLPLPPSGGSGGALSRPPAPVPAPSAAVPAAIAASALAVGLPAAARAPMLAAGGTPVRIDVKLSIPDFYIDGNMRDGDYIPIGDALAYFFGQAGPSTGSQPMNVTELGFAADPINQYYFAEASILFGDPANPDPQQGWEIDLIVLTIILQELGFYIRVNNGAVSGGVSGTLFLKQGDPADYTLPRIDLSAEYPEQDPDAPEGWRLAGQLYPGTSIDLTALVYQFIYGSQTQPPDWIPQLTVDRLYFNCTTGSTPPAPAKPTEPTYALGGTISARWQPTIFGTPLKVSAAVSLDMIKAESSATATGTLTTRFTVNRLALEASLTFGVPEATYMFKVQFDEIWLQATTSWRGQDGVGSGRHQVVSLQLGGVTLGDMLEYLVNLAAPTLGFRLDSPWDALKRIDLSRFVLTVDPEDNIIEFVFNTNVDLVVMRLDSVGIRYVKQDGESQVNLILTGNFLGKAYGSDDPLSWDVVNDPPPAVPGQGPSLVNLRYLGLGQRVTYNAGSPETVAESVALLRKSMQPVKDPKQSPLSGQEMKYSDDSQWLIGLDVQLMETVDLGFIFNDPRLYGLSIALGGEKAGSLAGLRFEILYKKITNDIGMFRVELRVPDAFRTLQLGAVSVTLGIVVVEIYTNGNFKVDLGFPYNRDYSRSFSLQAAIFIGRGGIYFGVLNGDTSTKVPRITNGNFSPVLELGVGLAAGVGREINAGILKGGVYVEIEVMFQGVLAWFNPNSSGTAPAKYFACQGVVAIHGKVYGSVDFAIIKVSVTLEAYAQASVTFECYKPTVFDLSVSVEARAKIKFLFFSISFSFHVTLDVSFSIGSEQTTPWILAGNAPSSGFSAFPGSAARLPASALKTDPRRRKLVMRKQHLGTLRRLRMAAGPAGALLSSDPSYTLVWSPSVKYFPDSPRNAHVTLVPLVTVGDVPVNWSATVPGNANPRYRAAFVLCADTGMSPSAESADQVALRSSSLSPLTSDDGDTAPLAADILAQGLVLYALHSVPRQTEEGNFISAGQLSILIDEMKEPETMDTGFSIGYLEDFFTANIKWLLSGDPALEPDTKGAMSIPMPPFLSWTSPQAGDVDFNVKNKIGSWYEWGIARLLGAYFPVGEDPGPKPTGDDPADYESFASFMFRDFCLMIAQTAVQEAQKHMDNYAVQVGLDAEGKVQSLAEVAGALPRTTVTYVVCSGNTLESVAAELGATVAELEFLNSDLAQKILTSDVGTQLPVILGIAPQVLASDNAGRPFVSGQWDLGTVFHQTTGSSQASLSQVAGLFQVSDVATLLSYDNGGAHVNVNVDPNLLLRGSAFNLPQRTFTGAPADFDQRRTAAAFYTRYRNPDLQDTPASPDMAAWYAQAIATLNQAKLGEISLDEDDWTLIELQPGQPLTVPDLYQAAYTEPGTTNTYTTIVGDNLLRIGATLALQQDFVSAPPVHASDWPAFLQATTSPSAGAWDIPPLDGVLVQPGENIEVLVRRLVLDVTWSATAPQWTYAWSAVAVWIGSAAILAPLAVVTVPGARTASGVFSFNDLAQTYGVSIEDAAAQLQDVNGLFAQGATLTVQHLPAQDIDVLAQAVLGGDSFAAIVNQSSRMLMAGLQLPDLETDPNGHTVPDPENSSPLYDLIGQQFDVTVTASQPDATALALAVSSQAPWIELMNSFTAPVGTTLAQMQQWEVEYDDLLQYNPGINAFDYPLANAIVLITRLIDPIVAPAGTTEAQMQQLETQYPHLLDCNPRIGGFTYPLAQDETLLSDSLAYGGTLDYSYTNKQIQDNGPQTGLAANPSAVLSPNPQALPLSGTAPRTYGFENRVPLQSATALAIPPDPAAPANISGNATLWPFPESFLARAREQAGETVKTPYEILSASAAGAAGRHANALAGSTYGTLLPFRVRRLDDGSNRFTLLGVETELRATLLALQAELADNAAQAGSCAYVLLSPAPNASFADGLALHDSPVAGTYLVKSNLSTESLPEPPQSLKMAMLAGDPVPPLYFATLESASLADFLLLLWEGSVVGGTGYFFGTKKAVPASAFDSQGNATLELLVIVKTQQQSAATGRALLPFNNCLLMAAGLDVSIRSLFAESYDDGMDTITNALLPPGNIGFRLALDQPVDSSDPETEQEVMLRNLYSLLCFEIPVTVDSPYSASASGMPVPPLPWDGTLAPPSLREKNLRRARQAGTASPRTSSADPAAQYWRYDQVLPLYNFVKPGVEEAAPEVAGLPSPAGDPYRGLGLQTSMPPVHFQFGFADLLGNRSAAVPGCAIDGLAAGYTDNLIGVGEWPAIASTYEVTLDRLDADASVSLTALISARPSALLPDPTQSGEVSFAAADQQAKRYAQSYYQLVQGEIGGFLVTTLKLNLDAAGQDAGLPLADLNPLIHFAGGAYAHAATVAALGAANAVALLAPAPPAGLPLSQVVASFGVRYVEIALANAEQLVESLFGPAPLQVPAYLPFVEHDSIDRLCTQTPQGWPTPTPAEVLAFPGNLALLLRPGTALKITPASVPTGAAPTSCLADLAALAKSTPALLANDNAGTAQLDPAFVFTMPIDDGQSATVPADPSTGTCPPLLNDVKAAFAEQGVNVSIGDLATGNAASPGMFAAGQNLVSNYYTVRAGDTLAANGSGCPQADLISKNTGTADLFDPGALVYFGPFAGVTYGDAPPTLRQFADRFACPMELLLSANASATLPADSPLVVPGMLVWPTDTTVLRIPYTLHDGDTLTLVAGRFSSPGGAGGGADYLLALANELMPCIFTPDTPIEITVGTTTTRVVTTAEDSFASVVAQVPGAYLTDLVTAITTSVGVLRTGGLMLCAPASLPRACAPSDIQGLYTVSPAAFAFANAATPGLIAGSKTLYSTDGTVSVPTQAGDTFNSLIARFAGEGAHMDAGDIATAPKNLDTVFLNAGIAALLAPGTIALPVTVADAGAYPKATGPYPGPIFPLEVGLRLTRPLALVAQEFRTPDGTGPVERADSVVPAPARGKEADPDSGLTFDQFISMMKTALPTLRLATGKAEGESSDLWGVDFNPSNAKTGIASVALTGPTTVPIDGKDTAQPRYFGLTPLYDHLVTRADVGIQPLQPDGSLGAAVSANYQGVDTEMWAQRFLADLDRFLSGPYATALYEDAGLRTYLTTTLTNKGLLIPQIAAGVDYVLDLGNADQTALQSAQGAFEQQLGVSLSRAYATSVSLQYDAAVSSPWQAAAPPPPPAPANLFGDMAMSGTSAAVSMIAAKTDLSAAASYVNVLMTVGDPAHNAEVDGSLAYDLTHLEFNISDANVPQGYTASDWLDFVPVLAGAGKPGALQATDPGPLNAPVPLRIFPGLPVIQGQTADAPYPADAATLGQYALWTYGLTYSHQHAEQDYVRVTAEFNLKPAMQMFGADEPRDLFTELAQYAAVADSLWNLLTDLTAATPANPAILANAVATFSDLAGRITSYWSTRIPQEETVAAADDLVAEYTYLFNARVGYAVSAQGPEIASYTLSMPPDQGQPGPQGAWPAVQYVNADGSFVDLLPGTASGGAMIYSVPAGVSLPAPAWPAFRIKWNDLNVSAVQNARCRLSVERNQNLIKNSEVPTNPAFLFKTAEVMANSVVTPLLNWGEPQPITGADAGAALQQALDTLFPVPVPPAVPQIPTLNATFGIFYAYELIPDPADPSNSLKSKMPASLYPNQTLSATLTGEIQAAITAWDAKMNSNKSGGEWTFSLTLYSAEETALRPVLVIDEMYYRIPPPEA